MTWSVSGAEDAVRTWISQSAPSAPAVGFVLHEWLPLLRELGPFDSRVGSALAVDIDTGVFLLAISRDVSGLFADVTVDSSLSSVVIDEISSS